VTKGEKVKKAIITLSALVLFAGCPWAQTVRYINSGTVAWDPVDKLTDGSAIPAGDVVEYEVYRAAYPDGPEMLLATVTESLYRFTSPDDRTAYALGVRAKRTTDGGATVTYSGISWSYDPLAAAEPFLIRHKDTRAPATILHIRVQ
jgi:hypothetical protein